MDFFFFWIKKKQKKRINHQYHWRPEGGLGLGLWGGVVEWKAGGGASSATWSGSKVPIAESKSVLSIFHHKRSSSLAFADQLVGSPTFHFSWHKYKHPRSLGKAQVAEGNLENKKQYNWEASVCLLVDGQAKEKNANATTSGTIWQWSSNALSAKNTLVSACKIFAASNDWQNVKADRTTPQYRLPQSR